MNQIDEYIWVLITRELSGEATQEESRELEKWLSEARKNRDFFNWLSSTWEDAPQTASSSAYLFDFNRGMDKLNSKLQEERIVAGQRVAKYRETPVRSRFVTWKIAASILVVALASSIFLTSQAWDEPVYAEFVTSDFEQRIITLSDGSVVRLNKNSRMEVLNMANDLKREVRLHGEAFFDVAGSPDRPFVIQVGEAVVEVLGTSFNVKEGREIMVAVKDGLVSFRHRDMDERSAARLSAGHLGLLLEDGNEIKVRQTNIDNYVAWMNGSLRFESMPFDQVLSQLEHLYGLRFELEDPALRTLQLTAYTERMQIEEVLETIARALKLEYEQQGTTIRWRNPASGK